MNLKELLLSAGSAVLNVFAPGTGTVVHKLLSGYVSDKDLPPPEELTGDNATALISKHVSPEIQKLLLERSVEIETLHVDERKHQREQETEQARLITEEIISGKSGRPFALRGMVYILGGEIAVIMLAIFIASCVNIYLVVNGKTPMALTDILPAWQDFAPLLGAPAICIIAHFRSLNNDHKISAVQQQGGDVSALMGLTSAVASRIVKK